jgi:hypothetical protein
MDYLTNNVGLFRAERRRLELDYLVIDNNIGIESLESTEIIECENLFIGYLTGEEIDLISTQSIDDILYDADLDDYDNNILAYMMDYPDYPARITISIHPFIGSEFNKSNSGMDIFADEIQIISTEINPYYIKNALKIYNEMIVKKKLDNTRIKNYIVKKYQHHNITNILKKTTLIDESIVKILQYLQ